MFKVIVIKPNNFTFDDIIKTSSSNNFDTILTKKANYINIEKMKQKCSDFIKIKEVDDKSFMEDYVKLVELDIDHYGDVKDCYEIENNIYQIFCKLPNQDDNVSKLKHNVFGSFLTLKKELLYGTVILFKTILPTETKESLNGSVSFEEMLSLLMCNFYYTGLYVHDNNVIEEIYFNNKLEFVDPRKGFTKRNDLTNILTNQDFGTITNNLTKFNLDFIIDKNSKKSINDPISRLVKNLIRGEVLIVSPYSENVYMDITKDNIIKLLKTVDIKDIEPEDEYDEFDRRIIMNKYRLLNQKLLKL